MNHHFLELTQKREKTQRERKMRFLSWCCWPVGLPHGDLFSRSVMHMARNVLRLWHAGTVEDYLKNYKLEYERLQCLTLRSFTHTCNFLMLKFEFEFEFKIMPICVTRGGADKSLARPERKQATATKLGIYSTYSPRSSIHVSARCSNFCKPLKKM